MKNSDRYNEILNAYKLGLVVAISFLLGVACAFIPDVVVVVSGDDIGLLVEYEGGFYRLSYIGEAP